jgi:hypothetical protein
VCLVQGSPEVKASLRSYTRHLQVQGRVIDVPTVRPRYPDIDTELHNGTHVAVRLAVRWKMCVTSRGPKPRQYQRRRGLLLRNAYSQSKNIGLHYVVEYVYQW